MITIVMVLVLIVVLAVYYCWSVETAASIMELAVISAESTATTSVTATTTKKCFSRSGVKQYLRKALLEEESEDIALPCKSNHLFSEATNGEWGKYGYSHYGKGVTLRDYRRGTHLSKKVLHPCMGGDEGFLYD